MKSDKQQNIDGSLFSQQELDDMDGNLFASSNQNEPVWCLGMEFESDEARREYFRAELRKKLPELRNIEGFPIGEDDDIIALSDPPYYTACPNPWLNDFIAQWEEEKKQLEVEGKRRPDFQVSEPYAADVSEGKYDPLYMYHPYLTKVPPKAIGRYIKHYTQPGDIIFDGFCGTGMTGIAATLNNRRAICSDLSSLATFIGSNYLGGVSVDYFVKFAKEIINTLRQELGWMYTTHHVNGEDGAINYTLWSEVYICPNCGNKIVFWKNGVDKEHGKVKDVVTCDHCSGSFKKRELEPSITTNFDPILGKVIQQTELAPVKINYNYKGKRYEKEPDTYDISVLEKIDRLYSGMDGYHSIRMPDGDEGRRNDKRGITHSHQYYFNRTYCVLNLLAGKIKSSELFVLITKVAFQATKLYRYTYMNGCWGAGGGPLSGTLYIPSLIKELNVFSQIEDGITKREVLRCMEGLKSTALSLQSATSLANLPDNSIDYIFTDPPFGANLMYAELNSLSESWLKVHTQQSKEAIVSKVLNKGISDYQTLITESLKEYFRILKPNKWLTLEFSNTAASVWNSIIQALQSAGFVIGNVSALDKKKGSFKAVNTPTAVKQDLVITCYKPSDELTMKMTDRSKAKENVWDFVDEYLEHLPVHIERDQKTTSVVERSAKILFDRMISYYVVHGMQVPMDARDFQAGLRERYTEVDGMFFTGAQAHEYQEKKRQHPEFIPMGLIVSDEANGIEWLKNFLKDGPKPYNEIQPEWLKALQGKRDKDIIPELQQLLEENFISEKDNEGKERWRLVNIHDDKDVEAIRNRALLREFNSYVERARNPREKFKEGVRVEALRMGFKQCYIDKDFRTIVELGERIPQNLLTEDEVLLQFFDIAQNKL